MNNIKQKVIVVTGGMGLLGSEFITYLRNHEALVIAVDKVGETDINTHYINADITDVDSIKSAIKLIVDKFGRIDGWVNNAYPRTADWGKQEFSEESMESFEKNVTWHLVGYVKCCQQVLNQMKKQRNGSLINVASIYGIVGPDFSIYEGTTIVNPSAYAAIKGGLINFTRYLAAYYGSHGVRVNCISPGGIFDHQPFQFVRQYEAKVPLRRLGTPQDIAPSVAFLLSEAANYITGHNLVIDGGWTAI
ncbi:NAD(P)-dependent dehydrogenase, short-chain alcohol dehydrogenase family [Chitinophaga costaii]|uniref:NAD(P)-dependent dehydrogenase, short-chain alcohol dehydrogenase family n=1 Tax=Chitinophaga costaii TaxID=1335309 RepID=A0A1C4F838_9BACT|nr:SDR family oxidoreductase [Chitinophaga costaii]PUZ21202.1 short-chain dehydrogenase [Chitinophaga costaii]SCC52004.1 NAD(P)-dependent dehydrogenase, short-chain alcohol dehydrogenase family [Chitinophaga costaii]